MYSDPKFSELVKKYAHQHKKPCTHNLAALMMMSPSPETRKEKEEKWVSHLTPDYNETEEQLSKLINYHSAYDKVADPMRGRAQLPNLETQGTPRADEKKSISHTIQLILCSTV